MLWSCICHKVFPCIPFAWFIYLNHSSLSVCLSFSSNFSFSFLFSSSCSCAFSHFWSSWSLFFPSSFDRSCLLVWSCSPSIPLSRPSALVPSVHHDFKKNNIALKIRYIILNNPIISDHLWTTHSFQRSWRRKREPNSMSSNSKKMNELRQAAYLVFSLCQNKQLASLTAVLQHSALMFLGRKWIS